MQNVLKRKNIYLVKKSCSQKHFIKTFVLDHSGLFDMHIGKPLKKICGGVRNKNVFCRTGGGGGLRSLRTCPKLIV